MDHPFLCRLVQLREYLMQQRFSLGEVLLAQQLLKLFDRLFDLLFDFEVTHVFLFVGARLLYRCPASRHNFAPLE